MTDNLTEPPRRYTSYHSDKTFSRLGWARQRNKEGSPFSFECNGVYYTVEPPTPKVKKWVVFIHGPMYKHLMPWSGGEDNREVLAEFDRDKFEEFIDTFEIEGKTVKWILEHQKGWKYKFSAKHLEETLTGFSFWFVYRKMPCGIYYVGATRDGQDITPDIFGNYRKGRYLVMYPSISFDVTQYGPLVPGAEHWFDAQGRFPSFDSVPQIIDMIECGPFQTDGELLDTVRLNKKTLREIFDTEYDDGAVCCGMFDG